jgi:hypothetical protein
MRLPLCLPPPTFVPSKAFEPRRIPKSLKRVGEKSNKLIMKEHTLAKAIVGDNDRVHSNNNVYCDKENEDKQNQFDPYDKKKFWNRLVTITNSDKKVLDHQGHIVPQNYLEKVLNKFLEAANGHLESEEIFIKYIAKNEEKYPWAIMVDKYGEGCNIKMFDSDEGSPKEKLRNFLSIVIWNPVNICRAPEDSARKGYPGNGIDREVVKYITNNIVSDKSWREALSILSALKEPKETDINDYITACSKTLESQLKKPCGYYAFEWESIEIEKKEVLKPKGVSKED